jgi:hypothetical protein
MSDDEKPVELIPYDPQDNKEKIITPQTDVEVAKDNIKGILQNLTPAFLELVDIARQSQHEKYFAALSSLAKTMVDANKELMNVTKTDKEIEKIALDNEQRKAGSGDTVTNVENNLFVTSSEMLDQIMEKLSKAKKKVDKHNQKPDKETK